MSEITAAPEAAPVQADASNAHAIGVVAWDVPSAVVAGERFRIKAGVKCASECRLAGVRCGVYDHTGASVGDAALASEVWPGTSGLYVAEVELTAPAAEGLYDWSVKAAEADLGAPHGEASTSFGVRIVSRPDHLVTIEVVDRASQAPVPGARVIMHPYRTETDGRGMARVRVAKGAYRLFVSQTRYITVVAPVDVAADVTTRAELDVEPVQERN
jgi:hypothetical protein